MDEIDDPLPGPHVLRPVHARASEGDAAVLAHVGHLGDHQPGAADGPASEVNEMPVVRRPVLCGILAHGADDDAIDQIHPAQPERGEDRRKRPAFARPRPSGLPAVPLGDRLDQFRIAQA